MKYLSTVNSLGALKSCLNLSRPVPGANRLKHFTASSEHGNKNLVAFEKAHKLKLSKFKIVVN